MQVFFVVLLRVCFWDAFLIEFGLNFARHKAELALKAIAEAEAAKLALKEGARKKRTARPFLEKNGAGHGANGTYQVGPKIWEGGDLFSHVCWYYGGIPTVVSFTLTTISVLQEYIDCIPKLRVLPELFGQRLSHEIIFLFTTTLSSHSELRFHLFPFI